jgi:hypothetical protein
MSVPGVTGADMAESSKSDRKWSDSQLKNAVTASANWRDVMRALGLSTHSAGAIRIVRRHADNLGLLGAT